MYRQLLLVFCVFVRTQSYLNSQKGLCQQNDIPCVTKLSQDIYNIAVNGEPSANIKSLDPLKAKYIEGKFFILNYRLYNTTLLGLKDCYIENAQLALEKKSMKFKLVCPYLYMYGIYDISGILILVPIEGNGDYKLNTKNYDIYINVEANIIENKYKKQVLNFKSFSVTGDVKGGMVVDLTNLFNGQYKEFADAALKFANEQWKPVADQFQGPILNANVKKLLKNMNKYLKQIPVENLFRY